MKDNSNVKIRSHQQFITPHEGGSFRQLTSTRKKKEKWGNAAESRENTIIEGDTAHKGKDYQARLADMALVYFLIR